MSRPRTRDNRIPRDDWKIDKQHVGDESFEMTCPRCGWPCTHLVKAYWDSDWNEHGGFCSQCCKEAVDKFDMTSWPADPRDAVEVKPFEEGAPKLWQE